MASDISYQVGESPTQARRHACCSIIPPHMLQHIISYEGTPEPAREAARFTLAKTQDYHDSRVRICRQHQGHQHGHDHGHGDPESGGQGIIPPHMLHSIAGSDANAPGVREAAERNLRTSAAIRKNRGRPSEDTPGEQGHLDRQIYNSHRHSQTPGDGQSKLVRKEGQDPVSDQGVNNVYDFFGDTFKFYWEVFHRNSVDDKGLSLVAAVHFDDDDQPPGYNNAMWSGEGLDMLFGDGDQILFSSFTKNLDVIGHELTHGVTQFTAGLDYENQCGALNESISDVFGSMVNQYKLGQTSDEADWLIGDGIFTSVRGALRSMKDPGFAYDDPQFGKDPQPADMAHFRNLPNTNKGDWGGVHINSGIPNRAFFLVATALGGHSWERAGQVWYQTLLNPKLKANPKADFIFFANLTLEAAASMGSEVVDAVTQAWTTVGVLDADDGSGQVDDGQDTSNNF